MSLTELSLFTGYGGLTLGLRLTGLPVRTIGYCDNEHYIQKLIKARIKDGFLDDAPVIGDICTDWTPYRGLVDIITAGFPCQPHSNAGKREGEADERNLWPDTRRCISEVGPRFVLLENVPGIISNGYAGVVTGELSELGYDAVWGIVSAADVGAPHLRKRWWCLGVMADSEHKRYEERMQPKTTSNRGRQIGVMADTDSQRGCGRNTVWQDAENAWESSTATGIEFSFLPVWPPGPSDIDKWRQLFRERPDLAPAITQEAERSFRGVDDGPAHRVDRLKATGNGVVPAVVAEFLSVIMMKQEVR
jgi:DNA (cytosine-5)-methyltransferase 1